MLIIDVGENEDSGFRHMCRKLNEQTKLAKGRKKMKKDEKAVVFCTSSLVVVVIVLNREF